MAAMARRQGAPGVSAPGPGNTADSMGLLQTAYGLIQQALPGFQAGTPQHTSILRVMQLLSRHMGQGAGTEATQKVQLMDLMREGARNAVQQQMLRMQQQGGNQGPQAPMPSTALPGA